MTEFYTIFARKYFTHFGGGANAKCPLMPVPPSPTPIMALSHKAYFFIRDAISTMHHIRTLLFVYEKAVCSFS